MENFFKNKIKELSCFDDIKFKPFYESAYWVSNYGHIVRFGKFKSGYNIKTPRLLKFSLVKGYYAFSIRTNSKNKTYRVHQVVAKAFLGKMPKSKECINHKDGNKLNNCSLNLEYVTHAENRKHAVENKLAAANPNQKLSVQEQEEIRRQFKPTIWSNAKELSVKYNVTETTIKRIASNKELCNKETCKHEPSSMSSFKMAVDRFNNRFYKHFNTCQYCGIELVAEWKEKK